MTCLHTFIYMRSSILLLLWRVTCILYAHTTHTVCTPTQTSNPVTPTPPHTHTSHTHSHTYLPPLIYTHTHTLNCIHACTQVDMLFDKSSLSPYIRFGCLSVRYFLDHVKQLASKDSSAETLLKDVTGKLLQREFYFTVAKQVSMMCLILTVA